MGHRNIPPYLRGHKRFSCSLNSSECDKLDRKIAFLEQKLNIKISYSSYMKALLQQSFEQSSRYTRCQGFLDKLKGQTITQVRQ